MARGRIHDREIVALALPALGALAAEPLYLLADTAIVGHLGHAAARRARARRDRARRGDDRLQLPRLRHDLAGRARARRPATPTRAHELGSQAVWLGLALGLPARRALTLALAGPRVALLGRHGHVASLAARYLRISSAGVPAVLLATAGQGYLRGIASLRRPLEIVIAVEPREPRLELVARLRPAASASTARRSERSSRSSAMGAAFVRGGLAAAAPAPAR